MRARYRIGKAFMLDKDAAILLVEDDRVDIMTVQRALKRNNIRNPLYVARTGLEALGMLRGDGFEKIDPPPALILLDLNLPGLDGMTLLGRIRAERSLARLPVIVITEERDRGTHERALLAGATDTISKPVVLSELLSRVERCSSG